MIMEFDIVDAIAGAASARCPGGRAARFFVPNERYWRNHNVQNAQLVRGLESPSLPGKRA
jgi:hypothetical protein